MQILLICYIFANVQQFFLYFLLFPFLLSLFYFLVFLCRPLPSLLVSNFFQFLTVGCHNIFSSSHSENVQIDRGADSLGLLISGKKKEIHFQV